MRTLIAILMMVVLLGMTIPALAHSGAQLPLAEEPQAPFEHGHNVA